MDKNRKIIKLPIFLILAFLTGCGGSVNEVSESKNVETYNCAQNTYLGRNTQIAVSPEGFYAINGLGESQYLTYISKETLSETVVCGKPECGHVKKWSSGLETCDAYIGSVLPCSIQYYNGYVYVLRYDLATYDVTLVRISEDGSTHEDVMVVGKSADWISSYSYVFVSDSEMYMIYDAPDYTGDEREIVLEKVNLDKKSKENVYSYSAKGATLSYLKVYGDEIYFLEQERLEGDFYANRLVKYNTKTGTSEKVLEDDVASYVLGNDGYIYYLVNKKGLYKAEINGSNKMQIATCEDGYMYGRLACDDMYLYLDNLYNRLFYDENSQHNIFMFDREGNLLSQTPCDSPIEFDVLAENTVIAKNFSSKGEYWIYISTEALRQGKADWKDTNIKW